MSIKPNQIESVLDLARKVNKDGHNFYPAFIGAPGIAKSSAIQQWCKKNNLPFIDLRAAYLEAPDIIGFPSIEGGITKHNVPEFLPRSGEGVLLIEEPNRGTAAVLNTFMQLLTDRKIHNYELPSGWMIVAALNPEDPIYEVQVMDPALKNRFQFFTVEYDKSSFLEYMRKKNWRKEIISFIESGTWSYQTPESVQKGGKYISPRTFEALNSAMNADFNKEIELAIYDSVLGKQVSKLFYAFINDDRPVFLSDLLSEETRPAALAKLKEHSNPSDYKNGHISVTIRDIIDDGTIEDSLLIEVCLVLPADQATILIKELEYKKKDYEIFKRITKASSALSKKIKSALKGKANE